ncbi:MAG: hypothetical protein AABX84_00100 [Nanoarchaeota archaeon]
MECFKCGISDERALLFDAISHSGIVKICRRCSIVEDIPIIRVKTEEEIEQQKKTQEVSRRQGFSSQRSYLKQPGKDDMALRKLVDENFRKNFKEDSSLKENLIDNFHWTIMRARRAKHMTQEQFANAIKEPIIAIKTIEQGYVPERSRELISKIESYLFIRLRKDGIKDDKTKRDLSSFSNLTVSDLKDINKGASLEHVELNEDLKFEDK